MNVRTRFAPSPTGFLHIGGARTALFNYLFAKHFGGKFLLRIEDTDQERSTEEAKAAIINSMKWLDLQHDEEVVYQSKQLKRHQQVVDELLAKDAAYRCFVPQEEINSLRQKALANKEHFIFESPWRDKSIEEHPKGQKSVIRIKAPRDGVSKIKDGVQGEVEVQNSHLDDMVLLRADGTPTYMLAVVVDDHDMGITHIIRGDDHLNNAFRQKVIYDALGWEMPEMVHIPLIHGPDGAKLSKRHGALGVEEYQKMGYLSEAMNNYLLRLGWAHGDDEIISRAQAIEWFDIKGLGKSPARLDFDKMKNVNAHYLRNMDVGELADALYQYFPNISATSKQNLLQAIDSMKPRVQLMTDMYDMAPMFMSKEAEYELELTSEAREIIAEADLELIEMVCTRITEIQNWDLDEIKSVLKDVAAAHKMKLGELMKYIRAYITGKVASPSVFEIIHIIGKDETIRRLTK